MRLSEFEISAIKKTAATVFGESVNVRLFGSRTDDTKKGGDIDLFITSHEMNCLTLQLKVEFLVQLKRIIGDQKIDVVFDTPCTTYRMNFIRSICQTAMKL